MEYLGLETLNMKNTDIKQYSSSTEEDGRDKMLRLLLQTPIPDDQLLSNLGLFLDSKNLSRFLFMDYLYRLIIDVQGVVFEFGTRWGQNMALLQALRGIYEPFNRHRKLVAFDTFEGFPNLHEKDGKSEMMKPGQLSLSENYNDYLNEVLEVHESLNPLDHIKKFELVKGDACKELSNYIEENSHTIVALAYFDFDLYEPTKKCLELIKPRLTKGSVLGFDELNDPDSPGETLAVMEELGLQNICLKRFPHASRVSYCIID